MNQTPQKDEANPTDGPAADAARDSAEAAAETPEAAIARLQAEVTELKDRALRALADAENTRRRAEREVGEARRYGASGLARELLNVADNLGRALQSVDVEAAARDESTKTLLVGVQMVERDLTAAFERQGIRRLVPQGEPFNHDLHQAMYEVESAEQPPGTVVEVLQPGYVMHDRLLRPAMVAVAKAAPGGPPDETARVDTTA